MSHVVHPYSHRLGIIKDWKSRWFGVKGEYQKRLKGDILVRELLQKRLRGMYVSGVDIERGPKLFRIIIRTSRPGMLIGKSGEGAVKLKNEILSFAKKNALTGFENLKLDIEEVRSPETDARIVAEEIKEDIEKRVRFRRILKQAVERVMTHREVKGAKIMLSGRLDGAEMSRTEWQKRGRVPLQTIRANLDYALVEAHTTYGSIGIKVWIYKGDVFEKEKEKERA